MGFMIDTSVLLESSSLSLEFESSLVSAVGVLAGAAFAGALGVQVGGLSGDALVDVEALLLAALAHMQDEAGPAHALVPAERVLALRLAVLPATGRQSNAVQSHCDPQIRKKFFIYTHTVHVLTMGNAFRPLQTVSEQRSTMHARRYTPDLKSACSGLPGGPGGLILSSKMSLAILACVHYSPTLYLLPHIHIPKIQIQI